MPKARTDSEDSPPPKRRSPRTSTRSSAPKAPRAPSSRTTKAKGGRATASDTPQPAARVDSGERLSVLMVTPEAHPFAKTGGLAEVAGALTDALAHIGH